MALIEIVFDLTSILKITVIALDKICLIYPSFPMFASCFMIVDGSNI